MSGENLAKILTLANLKKLASEQSFERGEEYFAIGRVLSLARRGETLTAMVQGYEKYKVRLGAAADSDNIEYDCSCPFASEDGQFCKHCVAVALAWLDTQKDAKQDPTAAAPVSTAPASAAATARVVKFERKNSPDKDKTAFVRVSDLRPWLRSQPKEELAKILLEIATDDDSIRNKLLNRIARTIGKKPNIKALRAMIDRATDIPDFFGDDDDDDDESPDFIENLFEVVETLKDLAKNDFHAVVRELVEYALERIRTQITEVIDDSVAEIEYITTELFDIHINTLSRTEFDAVQFAQNFQSWFFSDNFYFGNIVGHYAKILGNVGLEVLRVFGNERLNQERPNERERINHTEIALRTIASITGDIEALVELATRDLSSSYSYLRAAEIYHQAGQHDKALEWAERGIEKFPITSQEENESLVDFLIEKYLHYKTEQTHNKAIVLAWDFFEKNLSFNNYKKLKQTVLSANCVTDHDWPACRLRALDILRKSLDEKIQTHNETQKKQSRSSPSYLYSWNRPDYSELVRVLLYEKENERAWEAATEKGCDESLWLELAKRCAALHPSEALAIYLRHAHACVSAGSNDSYKEAIRHLSEAKKLYENLNQPFAWDATLAIFRQTYRRKRNFFALLDALEKETAPPPNNKKLTEEIFSF